MPVEIKELVIRATVEAQQGQGGDAAPPSRSGGSDRTALVRECVEQVLEILREREER